MHITSHDQGEHHFRIAESKDFPRFLDAITRIYLAARSWAATTLSPSSLEGTGFTIAKLEQRIRKASLPEARISNEKHVLNDVLRGDFAEAVAVELLRSQYGTSIAVQSIQYRELTHSPGRGIDVIGIEGGNPQTLVFVEAKIGDEDRSPPRVVDKTDDCMLKQHIQHLGNREETASKIFHSSRYMTDSVLKTALCCAVLQFENEKDGAGFLRIASACILVRAKSRAQIKDFGKFYSVPKSCSPAQIRFWIMAVPDDVDTVIGEWRRMISTEAEANV